MIIWKDILILNEKSFESRTKVRLALSRLRPTKKALVALFSCPGGDGWRNFEPIGRLSYSNIDRIMRKLKRIYQEKPNLFDVPTFAQKVY